MIFARFAPLVVLTVFAGPAPKVSTLTVSISSDPASASAPLRVVASSGTVTSAAKSYQASADTLRLTGTAELTTSDPVFAGTFIADAPGARLSVAVRENGSLVASGVGEAIVVIRTPLGAQLQATAASVLQRTR
jgi:hypothetical protein